VVVVALLRLQPVVVVLARFFDDADGPRGGRVGVAEVEEDEDEFGPGVGGGGGQEGMAEGEGQEGMAEGGGERYCYCRKLHAGEGMVECGGCGEWYHPPCIREKHGDLAGRKAEEALDDESDKDWFCTSACRRAKRQRRE